MTAPANGLSARDTETVMRALHITASPVANMQRHASASTQKKRSREGNEAALRNFESSQAVGSLRRREFPPPFQAYNECNQSPPPMLMPLPPVPSGLYTVASG